MNSLVKIIIRTGSKNNGKLFLRLCRNADRVRYINHLSKIISDKTMHKEQFHRIINIRTYGQLSEPIILSSETDSLPREEEKSHTNQNKTRYFRMQEIDYAHQFLQNSRHYDKTLVQPQKFVVIVTDEEALKILNKDWSTADASELVGALRKLSYNVMNSDENTTFDKTKYSNFFNALDKVIPNLDDQNLEETLKCLIPFSRHFHPLLQKTYQLLDKECSKRMSKWDVNKLLLMSDIFCLLYLHKKGDFMWRALRKMGTKPNKLTPKNLTQLLFLVSIIRKAEINMYELEVCLEENIDDLSINELGIAAMGFFKTKTKIRNSLFLKNIMNRLICDIENVDSISLAALMKIIRFSMQYNEIVHFRMLLNKIMTITDRLDLMCLIHIGHCIAKACIFEESLVNVIIERMHNNIKDARLKDIERFTFMLSTFDIDASHPIFDTILKEISTRISSYKKQEVSRYPGVLTNLLYYLSVKDIYSTDMLKIVMDQAAVEKIWKGNPYAIGYNTSILQACVQIDLPEYTGPFLPEGVYKGLMKRHWKEVDIKPSSQMNKLFNEIIYVFKEYVSSDINLYIGKLLPHYLPNDIVFGIDENRNLISAEPILSQLCEFSAKRVDDSFPKNVKWVSMIVIHYNHKIRGTNKPIGIIQAKMRQLKRVGYLPILVIDDDWLRHQTLKEKADYLKHLLEKV